MPALLTRMVMGPSVVSVLPTRSVTSAGFVTSAIWAWTGTSAFASARADSSRAASSRPQIDKEAPSMASCSDMARPIPRLPPVTSATAPTKGLFSRESPFVLFIRAMRILPRTGHSFYATLILSLEFSSHLGSLGGRERIRREAAICMKKFPQVIKLTIENVLRMGCGFPYNPKVFRTNAIPGRSIPRAPEAENSGLEFERGEMGMNATRRLTGPAMIATLFLIAGNGQNAFAQAPATATGQDAGAAKGPKYTQAEYNAEQACAAEKVPATVIKCADDFVSKYPNSDLLVY